MLRAYCVGFMHIFDPTGGTDGTRLHQVDLKRYQVVPKCSDYYLSIVPEGVALWDDNPAELIYTAAGCMSERKRSGIVEANKMTVHNLKVSRPKSNGTIANYFYNLSMPDPECPAVITKSMVFIDDDGLHYVDNEGVDTIVDDLVGADVVYLDRAIVFDGRPKVKQAK